MDIQTRKIQLVQTIINENNEQLLIGVESLLKRLSNDLEPISTEELNKRIDDSEEDFRNGRFKTVNQLLDKYV